MWHNGSSMSGRTILCILITGIMGLLMLCVCAVFKRKYCAVGKDRSINDVSLEVTQTLGGGGVRDGGELFYLKVEFWSDFK